MTTDPVILTTKFVKESFKKFPHFSFNDGRIMSNHSIRVKNIALKISKKLNCDKVLLAVAALLHDIGKTKKAPETTLHYNHEDYNYEQAEDLIKVLNLTLKQKEKLKNIILHKSRGIEQKIIKDADALALFADKKLYTLYITWAIKNNLSRSISRKLTKFSKLNFDISKKIGKPLYVKMKKDWQKYLKHYPQVN